MKILISKSAPNIAVVQQRLESNKAKFDEANAKYKAEPKSSPKKEMLKGKADIAKRKYDEYAKIFKGLGGKLDRSGNVVAQTTGAKRKPVDLTMLTFDPKPVPTIPQATFDKAIKKMPLEGMKKVAAKLQGRLLNINVLTHTPTPPLTTLMWWPFPFKSGDSKIKTVWGSISKYDLFSVMAGIKGNPEPKSLELHQERGYAKCRVCGVNLGMGTYVGAKLQCPNKALPHYRDHGINANMIMKNILDKATGKYFRVDYIGSVKELPEAI